MAKLTGFMDYARKTSTDVPPLERIENFNEFHIWLSREEQQTQAARCMDCGVPFCQAGMMIGGMASGCPLNNLIPEWNDLVYKVFVCGDMRRGQSLVVWGLREGRDCAAEVDRYLMGYTNL